MDNMPFVVFFGLQFITLVVLFFILKYGLNRYLISSALEELPKFLSKIKNGPAVVTVVAAREPSDRVRQSVQMVFDSVSGLTAQWRAEPALWGGIVFASEDKVMDFSMKSRIRYLFSSEPQ